MEVPSHDDKEVIPMTIVHREGLERTGTQPTLMTAYGAYGLNLEADYSPERKVIGHKTKEPPSSLPDLMSLVTLADSSLMTPGTLRSRLGPRLRACEGRG